jgi:hypothetical protein
MSRASNESMDSLHELAAMTIIEQINEYRAKRVLDPKTGEVLPCPPALLAQAIKFLKDNGIDAPARAVKLLDTLKDKLPDFEFEFGAPN